ncbi:MAG: tyrosine-protein phosphatase [Pyrinomonadaceae bacterium]|nr:tyrosine-protein phosphatase [Pyrinomonadaceae bacterium]
MRTRATQVFALMAMLVLLGAPVRSQQERQYKELPNFHKVNDMVYRGAQPRSGGLELLKQLGIKTAVNLRDDDDRAKQEEASARVAGLQYFNFPFARWGRPQDKEMEQVLSIINNPANQPVFVHCKHGADRTGVVVAVYRITHDGWTSGQAKAEAKRYGLKPWQLGMKDYIHDFYQRHKAPASHRKQ